MRKISFKAWDRDLKGWIVERILFSEGDAYILRGQMLVKCNAEVVQFSGLTDKNGKEIFEGDIIKGYEGHIREVYWQEDCWGVRPTESEYINLASHLEEDNYEIIGNVFEHPNLLAPAQ